MRQLFSIFVFSLFLSTPLKAASLSGNDLIELFLDEDSDLSYEVAMGHARSSSLEDRSAFWRGGSRGNLYYTPWSAVCGQPFADQALLLELQKDRRQLQAIEVATCLELALTRKNKNVVSYLLATYGSILAPTQRAAATTLLGPVSDKVGEDSTARLAKMSVETADEQGGPALPIVRIPVPGDASTWTPLMDALAYEKNVDWATLLAFVASQTPEQRGQHFLSKDQNVYITAWTLACGRRDKNIQLATLLKMLGGDRNLSQQEVIYGGFQAIEAENVLALDYYARYFGYAINFPHMIAYAQGQGKKISAEFLTKYYKRYFVEGKVGKIQCIGAKAPPLGGSVWSDLLDFVLYAQVNERQMIEVMNASPQTELVRAYHYQQGTISPWSAACARNARTPNYLNMLRRLEQLRKPSKAEIQLGMQNAMNSQDAIILNYLIATHGKQVKLSFLVGYAKFRKNEWSLQILAQYPAEAFEAEAALAPAGPAAAGSMDTSEDITPLAPPVPAVPAVAKPAEALDLTADDDGDGDEEMFTEPVEQEAARFEKKKGAQYRWKSGNFEEKTDALQPAMELSAGDTPLDLSFLFKPTMRKKPKPKAVVAAKPEKPPFERAHGKHPRPQLSVMLSKKEHRSTLVPSIEEAIRYCALAKNASRAPTKVAFVTKVLTNFYEQAQEPETYVFPDKRDLLEYRLNLRGFLVESHALISKAEFAGWRSLAETIAGWIKTLDAQIESMRAVGITLKSENIISLNPHAQAAFDLADQLRKEMRQGR